MVPSEKANGQVIAPVYLAQQFHLQCERLHKREVSEPVCQHAWSSFPWRTVSTASFCWFLVWRILLPWRWRRHDHPKHQALLELHGLTTQNAVFFIVTAVRASKSKSTVMSSYILRNYVLVVTSPRRWSQCGYQRCRQYTPCPLPPESRIHLSIEPPRRYTALPQNLKPSVVLLLLYYKKTVTATVPLPSACCSTGSDTHTSVFSVRFKLGP
jgi:hypothetical protein